MITDYENSFPEEIGMNLLIDLEPPKDLMIEIRVLEDIGEIVTGSGVLDLRKNSTFLVRRCDVEGLLRQNKIVQTK